jgi:lipopolysaccharide transport protein LptA
MMLSKLSFFSVFFIAVILGVAVLAGAQEAPMGQGPIVITAETLVADKKTNSAVFEGSVVARSEDMTLKSDRMEVKYGDGGTIVYIDATGNVTLLRGAQVVTAERAEYFAEGRKIVFTGSPRAVETSNVVTGTKMTYLIDEDRFIVEGSRVLLDQGGAGVTNDAGNQ